MIPNCKNEINNLLDLFYPIGIYIETSNEDFNPNTQWGGVWVEDTKGLTPVSAYRDSEINPNTNDKVYIKQGQILGETNHTLTINEMPSHRHSIFTNYNGSSLGSNDCLARPIGGLTEWKNNSVYMEATGGSSSHNNTQPSIGVYKWHRIK